MTTHKLIEASLAVYAVLLHLYPRKFHRAYGASMIQLFHDQCNDAVARRGRLGLLAVWLRTLLDLAVTAFQEHLQAAAGVGLVNEPVTPLPWRQVLLAILPGVLMVMERAGFQPWSSASLSPAWRHRLIVDSWFWASIALVVWSLLRHRRIAVWAYPAASLLLAIGPQAVMQALFTRPALYPWDTLVRAMLMLSVPIAGLVMFWKHRHRLRTSTFTWISVAMLAVGPALYAVTRSSAREFLLVPLVIGRGVFLAAAGLMGVRPGRVSGGLLVVGFVWGSVDATFGTTYGLGIWTDAYLPVLLIGLLPTLSIMILPVIGVLRARTTYRQLVNFIAIPLAAMALMITGRWALRETSWPAVWFEVAIATSMAAVLSLASVMCAQYDHGRPYLAER